MKTPTAVLVTAKFKLAFTAGQAGLKFTTVGFTGVGFIVILLVVGNPH